MTSSKTVVLNKAQTALVAKFANDGATIKTMNSETIVAGLNLGAAEGKLADAAKALYHATKTVDVNWFSQPAADSDATHVNFFKDLEVLAAMSISNKATRDDYLALGDKGSRLKAIKAAGGGDKAKADITARWDSARKAKNNMVLMFREARKNSGDANKKKRDARRAPKRDFCTLTEDHLSKIEAQYSKDDNASVLSGFVSAGLRQDFKKALKELRRINAEIGKVIANETAATSGE